MFVMFNQLKSRIETCQSSLPGSSPENLSNSATTSSTEDDASLHDNRSTTRVLPMSLLMRMVMRISRARWFTFLRRVFHYQNGTRSDLGSNPFNSSLWIALEFLVLLVQITAITFTLSVSKDEHPVWPLRIWVVCYDIASILSLPLLYWRLNNRHHHGSHGLGLRLRDIEQQMNIEESRSSHLMNRCRTFLELFFAIWFVMGNVWVFDSRVRSFDRAPKLHVLCISLLAWNAASYSFPFLLFLLLCCCVPLINNLLGYNMNLGSIERGATDDQISQLPKKKYIELNSDGSECCICLAKYHDKDEVRELPCSHLFHVGCVDQWLRIISCCPLCKRQLEK